MTLAPAIAAQLSRADQLWRNGRIDEAQLACRTLLAAHPGTAPALHLLAHLTRLKGDLAEAEELARDAMRHAPGDAAIANTLGNILYARGDVAEAGIAYGNAATLQPNYAEAHYNHGLMLGELGRTAQALAAQRRAAALRPYPEALTQIGAMLAAAESHAEALPNFAEALRLKPDYFDAFYYQGTSLTALQRYEEAEVSLRAALRQKPQSPEALHALGVALNYLNREADALATYEQAIAAAPANVVSHLDFNALAFTMGRTDLAYKSFAFARQRLGEVPALLLAEADQRLRLDDIQPAETLLRRAHLLAPDDASVMNALGRALTSQGRFDEAIGFFDQAAAQQPGNPAHRREQAVALLHARQPAAAAALLEAVAGQAPADQMALALLTLAWRETGDARHAALTDMDRHVRVYDLPPPPGFADVPTFNRALAAELSLLHTRKTEPHDQTLRGGTQTMGKLFGRGQPQIEALRARIDEAVVDYIARMPEAPDHPLFGRKRDGFAYSGSWSCRLSSSGFHTNHIHPHGWISSAYYVDLPEAIQGADRQGWITFGQSNLSLGERDQAFAAVQPMVGRLVLFPSYMWHGTMPFQSQTARLTVAFDVVPT